MRQLYEVWEDKAPLDQTRPWRAKMLNYTAEFPTKGQAEGFVEAVQQHRKNQGLK